jgi:hypothetical protein
VPNGRENRSGWEPQLDRGDLRQTQVVLVQCGFDNAEAAQDPVEGSRGRRALEEPFEVASRADEKAVFAAFDQRGAAERQAILVTAETEIAIPGGGQAPELKTGRQQKHISRPEKGGELIACWCYIVNNPVSGFRN